MMYSAFAFILTLIEVGAAVAGYAMQSETGTLIFYNVLVYGSPVYMLQHAFTAGSLIHESNPIYWGFLLFHLIKYFCIFRARWLEDSNIVRNLALLFEGAYIALSCYYIL